MALETAGNAPLKVVVTRQLPEPVETRLSELFNVELNSGGPMSEEALGDAMARADVLVTTIGDQINQRLLAKAGANLRLIA
ncbi:MAG TPA: hypothetical protein EYG79_11935, partial [Rhodobacteraceae bacterium]|nr:hypothetical protein [Paracoccaceae bacterium]